MPPQSRALTVTIVLTQWATGSLVPAPWMQGTVVTLSGKHTRIRVLEPVMLPGQPFLG